MEYILESHDLIKCHEISDHEHPRIIKVTFRFPEFLNFLIFNFLTEVHPTLASCDPRGNTPIFDYVLPEHISIKF